MLRMKRRVSRVGGGACNGNEGWTEVFRVSNEGSFKVKKSGAGVRIGLGLLGQN